MGPNLVALVATLAVIELMVFSFLVGRGRGKYNVPAPATSGHPAWERLNRVHLNSLEQAVVFIPLLFFYSGFVSQTWAAILGAVFVVARVIYAVGYARAPEARAAGAILTFLVLVVLALGTLVGIAVRLAYP